jgi:hypothetical protein
MQLRASQNVGLDLAVSVDQACFHSLYAVGIDAEFCYWTFRSIFALDSQPSCAQRLSEIITSLHEQHTAAFCNMTINQQASSN